MKPTLLKLENLLLKEREYRDGKEKETNRLIIGAMLLGLISMIVSIISLNLS